MSMTSEAHDQQGGFGSVKVQSHEALNQAKISIHGLDFFYGDNKALKNINLNFPDRQVTGMIGPSVCGKSTLLRCLNRMYDLYPGQRATGEVPRPGGRSPLGGPAARGAGRVRRGRSTARRRARRARQGRPMGPSLRRVPSSSRLHGNGERPCRSGCDQLSSSCHLVHRVMPDHFHGP